MRRLLRLLFIGALLNVAIAWSLVAVDRPRLAFVDRHPMFAEKEHRWPLAAFDPWDGAPTIVAMYRGFGRRVVIYSAQDPSRAGWYSITKMYQAGWPLPSMQGAVFVTARPPMNSPPPTPTTFGAIPVREPLHGAFLVEQSRVVPLLPRPLGFLANSVLFGGFLWGCGAFHRAWRRRRGRCAWCGYDVGELETCPECGRAVRRRSTGGQAASGTRADDPESRPEATHG